MCQNIQPFLMNPFSVFPLLVLLFVLFRCLELNHADGESQQLFNCLGVTFEVLCFRVLGWTPSLCVV